MFTPSPHEQAKSLRVAGRFRAARFGRFGAGFCRLGCTVGRTGTAGAVRFGSLFVRIAPVVGNIKARPFEDQPAAGSNFSPQLGLVTFGANSFRIGFNRLHLLKFMLAAVADVIVGGHNNDLDSKIGRCCREVKINRREARRWKQPHGWVESLGRAVGSREALCASHFQEDGTAWEAAEPFDAH